MFGSFGDYNELFYQLMIIFFETLWLSLPEESIHPWWGCRWTGSGCPRCRCSAPPSGCAGQSAGSMRPEVEQKYIWRREKY